jgi:hypothetical protein
MLPSSPDNDPKKPSPTRIGIWLVVGGIAAYFLISGVVGILTPG